MYINCIIVTRKNQILRIIKHFFRIKSHLYTNNNNKNIVLENKQRKNVKICNFFNLHDISSY